MKLHELHEKIAAVCPIIGINSDGKIWFSPVATENQKAQAKNIMAENIAKLDQPQI